MELLSKFSERKRLGDERMKICVECEHYKPETTQCGKCGCFMKAKTLWPSSKCPIGKWDAYKKELTS